MFSENGSTHDILIDDTAAIYYNSVSNRNLDNMSCAPAIDDTTYSRKQSVEIVEDTCLVRCFEIRSFKSSSAVVDLKLTRSPWSQGRLHQ